LQYVFTLNNPSVYFTLPHRVYTFVLNVPCPNVYNGACVRITDGPATSITHAQPQLLTAHDSKAADLA